MTQQFNGVQILRFVAAMLVVVMHVTQAISIHITGQGESHYWAPGTAGVDIFFVISGFVMAMSTRGLPAGGPARKRAAWVFMKRRILRIVPLYWFYTLLKAALILAVPALALKSTIVPAHMAASLLFVPMTAPWGLVQPVLPVGWTLNFEMLFYTVFAIAIALGAPRIRFCLLVFLSLFLAGQAWRGAVPLVFYAQSIIFEFVLGVGVAQVTLRLAQRRQSGLDAGSMAMDTARDVDRQRSRVKPGMTRWGALLMLAGFVFMFAFGWRTDGERLFPWGAGAAIVVMGAVWLESWIERMPGVHPLSFLGDASYSIYLSHPFVVPAAVVALKRIGLEDTMVIALASCAAVVVAGALSHVMVEKPMISFFKRYLFPTVPRALPTTPNAGNSPVK